MPAHGARVQPPAGGAKMTIAPIESTARQPEKSDGGEIHHNEHVSLRTPVGSQPAIRGIDPPRRHEPRWTIAQGDNPDCSPLLRRLAKPSKKRRRESPPPNLLAAWRPHAAARRPYHTRPSRACASRG